MVAATTASPEEGLIRKGPAAEIGGDGTRILMLEVPAERPYVRACELSLNAFLARPGEPGDLVADLWVDPVPENHNVTVTFELSRPEPTSLGVQEPVVEVVHRRSPDSFMRHYEAPMRVEPVGSAWALRRLTLQTQTAAGDPVEVLTAERIGERLVSSRIIWSGSAARRDSVAQALLYAEYEDCDGVARPLTQDGLEVVLEER